MNVRAFLDPCPGCTTQHLLGRLRDHIEWASSLDHGRAVELDRVVASLELRWRGETSGPLSCSGADARPSDPDSLEVPR